MFISRQARTVSDSDVYHIMIRGNGRQMLFFDDQDRKKFIRTLEDYKFDLKWDLFAYCLMGNHVHLLLRATPEVLPTLMKKIEVRYASYFREKYKHVGHVFQDRFKSQPIISEDYFREAVRYIVRNPEKAGMCRHDEYVWSSYNSYFVQTSLVDRKFVLPYFGGGDSMKEYFATESQIELAEPKSHTLEPDDQIVIEKFYELTGIRDLTLLMDYSKERKSSIISEMKRIGATNKQISRLSGILYNTVKNIH